MCNYQGHIDWMWGDKNPCGTPVCLTYVVRAADPVLVRGPLSAKQCVQACVVSFLPLGIETAVRWLMAGQAHNPEAQACLWNNKEGAVAYAIAKFGKESVLTLEQAQSTPDQVIDGLRSIDTKGKASWADVMQMDRSKN